MVTIINAITENPAIVGVVVSVALLVWANWPKLRSYLPEWPSRPATSDPSDDWVEITNDYHNLYRAMDAAKQVDAMDALREHVWPAIGEISHPERARLPQEAPPDA